MITIEHGPSIRCFGEPKPIGLVRSYAIGKEPPNYPMPAIRYGTMLFKWHGEMRFVVVYANAWCGYATLISDEYVK